MKLVAIIIFVLIKKCPFCKCEVEDEIDFIVNCTSNNPFKTPFIESLDSLCKDFKNLCNKEKFFLTMSNECDTVYKHFANYNYFQLRKALCSSNWDCNILKNPHLLYKCKLSFRNLFLCLCC